MPVTRTFRLAEIAALVGGETLGDGNLEIHGIASLKSAGPRDLSFLSNVSYQSQLRSSQAGALLLAPANRDASNRPRIISEDPYLAYAKVVEAFYPAQHHVAGVHPNAVVHPLARLGNGVQLAPFCSVGKDAVIGDRVRIETGCVIGECVSIGSDCILHGNVTIYANSRIGERAIIHAGAVIGSDGFGMAREGEHWRKIPQIGGVIIGNDVEIGANTTIDRGALDDTVIEDGVKLDNQIQIGHNVHIGAHSAFAGCVGIAGSTRIGRRCTIGGGSVILGHLEIVDDVNIAAASVVMKSIRRAGDYAGLYPLQERSVWARNAANLRNLDGLERRLRYLESTIGGKSRKTR